MFGRNQLAILVAEFLGAGILALVMLSVQHSTIGLPYFIALAAGLTLIAMTLVFGRNGGGHFNPAITIGMWTARQIKTVPAVMYIVFQMLGAWVAYYLYIYFVKTSLQPLGGHYDGRVLVAEAAGALILSFAYAAAVFHRFIHAQTAATVGIAYALAIMVASSVSLGIINPAVAVSMRAFNVFGSMGWGTYVLGPVLGAIVGFNLYALLFAPESTIAHMRAAVSGRFSRGSMDVAAAKAPVTVAKPSSKRSSGRSRKSKK